MPIELRTDAKRGCGYRKPGGLYLIGVGLGQPCGKLPMPLDRCPCCGQGVKATRGWAWVDADALVIQARRCEQHVISCDECALRDGNTIGRAGLLWIGSKYYARPSEFCREAGTQGISRRLSQIPKGLKIGETWVLLAHRKCIEHNCQACGGFGWLGVSEACPAEYPADINTWTQQQQQIGWNRISDAEKGHIKASFDKCENCENGKLYSPGIFRVFKPTALEYVIKGDETPEKLERLEKRGVQPVRVMHDGELFETE